MAQTKAMRPGKSADTEIAKQVLLEDQKRRGTAANKEFQAFIDTLQKKHQVEMVIMAMVTSKGAYETVIQFQST